MARLNVNPTRMELTKLKKRLKVATRGHKLLKDKCDELMKQFLEIVKKNKLLREKTESALESAYKDFLLARAQMSSEAIELALMIPSKSVELSVQTKNIMSVDVPSFSFSNTDSLKNIYPYGFSSTTGELDSALETLSGVFSEMLNLAEMEKTAQLLAQEIEKTRRRVNALEYIMIPQLTETIKYITMKLDENERGNITRLMKVKDLMIKEVLEQKQAQKNA